jgi:fatty-acyl-CoA synthase
MTSTIAALVRARADDDSVGLIAGGQSWSWRQVVAEAAARAAWLRAALDPARPPHVGVLLPTVPEYVFQILGAALAGACVVGINPTRRGAELARDIDHTACQFVISDSEYGQFVDGYTSVDDAPWRAYAGAALPDSDPTPDTLLFLLLTSGSTSAPKAARCSQARLASGAGAMGFGPKAVLYCPLTLAHGNALNSCLFPALANGCRLVLRDRFSATGWLDDVRTHGVTFTTTVGRALGYVLATPPTPHDRDHRLRAVLAPEASPRDTAEFKERFGVEVLSGYGSSEGGIALLPAGRPGSLGLAPKGADVAVVTAAGVECETARFDADGKMRNADAAIGELVRRDAAGGFEGYWNNPQADADRLRGGWFWSGDLAYRDADGVFWFAGRVGDWLRVDSENFAVSPVERIVGRFPDAAAVAVVGVPDPLAGDQILLAMELRAGRSFDPEAFAAFLTAQPDLGTKWAPRFVRVMGELPVISQGKIDKKPIRRDAWLCDDPVWWRPARSTAYTLMTEADLAAVRDEFRAHGRLAAYPKDAEHQTVR